MVLEKEYYRGFFVDEKIQLLTYSELCSKIDEEYTVEKIRQIYREFYETEKDDEDFERYYPGCDTYQKYEE